MDCMRRRNYAGILLLSLTYWEPAASRRERSGRHPFRLAYVRQDAPRWVRRPMPGCRLPFRCRPLYIIGARFIRRTRDGRPTD